MVIPVVAHMIRHITTAFSQCCQEAVGKSLLSKHFFFFTITLNIKISMKILSYLIFGMPFMVQPSLHSQAWGYVHKSEDVYDMPCLYTEANNIR